MYPSTALKRNTTVTLKTVAQSGVTHNTVSASLSEALSAGWLEALSAPLYGAKLVALTGLALMAVVPVVSAQPISDAPIAATADTPRIPAGSALGRNTDPLKLYREAGIDKEQEYKIRKLAKTFEEQQRVRIGLLGSLLKDMRKLELQADPDEKKALAKQDEINKIQAEIGTERIKLLLAIRNVLTFEQKERLVQNIQKTQASLFEK